jgi:hypothetical protein
MASTLDDLTRRVTAMAERHQHAPTEDLAHALFEVERSLRAANRRLAKAVRTTR